MTQLAPYSQDAEEAVLGAVMVSEEAFHAIALFLKPDDFYIKRHSYIWEAFGSLVRSKSPLDFVTVQNELARTQHLSDIGGAAYLLHLVNSTPTSVNAEIYGRIVQRASVRRRLLICADEFKALALDEGLTVEKVLGDAERRFIAVRDTSLEDDSESFSAMIGRLMEDISARMENPDEPVGLLTGYHDLDEVTGGLHATDLTILAARPGVGKTSLLLNIALNAAKLGARVGIASQEMNRDQVVRRFASMESGVNSHTLHMGRLADVEWGSFVRACGILAKLPIFVDDSNRLTPMRLRTKCLRWRANYGLDLLIVDYLQILSSGSAFGPNDRVAEVGYFAREMKQLARELRIPVIAAAQLSRSLESRVDKRPMLSDLRESGEIEQEADVVQFIYRDVMYNEATEFPNRADLMISKHRNGATGVVPLNFERQTTRFSDARTQRIDLRGLT